MTDSVEADIAETLFSRLEDNEWSCPLIISYPGVIFTVNGQPYIDVTLHFNEVLQVSVGESGLNRYKGYLSASGVFPHGDGVLDPLRVSSEIVSLFKRGTELPVGSHWLRIIVPPRVLDPVETSGWIRVPVIIYWQLDHPNVT